MDEEQDTGERPVVKPAQPTLADFVQHVLVEAEVAGITLAQLHDALHELVGYRSA